MSLQEVISSRDIEQSGRIGKFKLLRDGPGGNRIGQACEIIPRLAKKGLSTNTAASR
jgi:hypothetical protein